ncbi:hypothetical protein SFA35_00450 [Pseudomonas sp. HR96]|uniref:PA0061/PA0062 family lipoprotein n=1 Tax=Pseudomonas sp. HR96 TaxID=1027966 RepID=UPI002A75A717|nr:hypothetical protein [Pseudomonas sp. HR96]WPO99900.1 hypothetical protein SFA35_00450 [Pseudomonas sp. HR96]
MRGSLMVTCLALASLAGCAGLPRPDPNQAWVDLHARQDNSLHAVQVDEQAWQDNRYFEVPPGSHELTVRLQFPVSASNIGPDAQPLWRDCQMNLVFKDFGAGQRYQLEAGNTGFRPWARLYDDQHNLVGKAQPAGCSRV